MTDSRVACCRRRVPCGAGGAAALAAGADGCRWCLAQLRAPHGGSPSSPQQHTWCPALGRGFWGAGLAVEAKAVRTGTPGDGGSASPPWGTRWPRPRSPWRAERGEQLGPLARHGSGGSRSPSLPGGSLDGRRLRVRNVLAGICHHLQTALFPPPPAFSPL